MKKVLFSLVFSFLYFAAFAQDTAAIQAVNQKIIPASQKNGGKIQAGDIRDVIQKLDNKITVKGDLKANKSEVQTISNAIANLTPKANKDWSKVNFDNSFIVNHNIAENGNGLLESLPSIDGSVFLNVYGVYNPALGINVVPDGYYTLYFKGTGENPIDVMATDEGNSDISGITPNDIYLIRISNREIADYKKLNIASTAQPAIYMLQISAPITANVISTGYAEASILIPANAEVIEAKVSVTVDPNGTSQLGKEIVYGMYVNSQSVGTASFTYSGNSVGFGPNSVSVSSNPQKEMTNSLSCSLNRD